MKDILRDLDIAQWEHKVILSKFIYGIKLGEISLSRMCIGVWAKRLCQIKDLIATKMLGVPLTKLKVKRC